MGLTVEWPEKPRGNQPPVWRRGVVVEATGQGSMIRLAVRADDDGEIVRRDRDGFRVVQEKKTRRGRRRRK